MPPSPWSITTGSASGCAGARDRDVAHRGAHAGELEPARLARPARGGEEADAEVEVVADLQPPAAERVHAARAGRAPPAPTSRGRRAAARRGARCGRRARAACEPRRTTKSQSPASSTRQPQPRAAGGSVEGGGVEARDQLVEHRGSGGHAAPLTRSRRLSSALPHERPREPHPLRALRGRAARVRALGGVRALPPRARPARRRRTSRSRSRRRTSPARCTWATRSTARSRTR